MPLDKIIVIVLALGFFGGIAYVVWKSKQEQKRGGPTSAPNTAETVEVDSSKKSHKRESRISKS